MKVLFFGIDGATWTVVSPLMVEGRLPVLRSLMERGSRGTLAGEGYPTSAELWTTIATGKRPDKHGVRFFGATARDVRARRVWDVLESLGWTVGVCGYLVTWPPQEVNGFMIPDLFALGPETYPAEYQVLQEVALGERQGSVVSMRRRLGQGLALARRGLSLDTLLRAGRFLLQSRVRKWDERERTWRKALLQPRVFADVFQHLLGTYRPDFASFHFHPTDTLSHRYWKYWDPEAFDAVPASEIARFGRVIPAAYERADQILGELLRRADPDTLVVVVSDHGFQPLPEGQFKYELRVVELLSRLGVREGIVPARLGSTYVFYCRSQEKLDALARELRGIRVCETGDPLFEVNVTDEFVPVHLTSQHQDLQGFHVQSDRLGRCGFGTLFEDRGFVDSGEHHAEGILVVAGPHIRPAHELPALGHPADVVPTLLAAFGLPVGRDMDGRVLEDVFSASFLKECPVRYIDTYEPAGSGSQVDGLSAQEEQALTERLRALGYL